MDTSARNDIVAAFLVLAVVGVFAPATSSIFIDPLDPGFSAQDFPVGVLSLLAVLAGTLLVNGLRALARSGWRIYDPFEAAPLLRFLLPVVALGFVYIWLMEAFQYLLPTFFALSASMAIFGNRGVLRLVVIPLFVTLIFYILFYGILGLNEPLGTIWSYENQWFFRPFRTLIGMP